MEENNITNNTGSAGIKTTVKPWVTPLITGAVILITVSVGFGGYIYTSNKSNQSKSDELNRRIDQLISENNSLTQQSQESTNSTTSATPTATISTTSVTTTTAVSNIKNHRNKQINYNYYDDFNYVVDIEDIGPGGSLSRVNKDKTTQPSFISVDLWDISPQSMKELADQKLLNNDYTKLSGDTYTKTAIIEFQSSSTCNRQFKIDELTTKTINGVSMFYGEGNFQESKSCIENNLSRIKPTDGKLTQYIAGRKLNDSQLIIVQGFWYYSDNQSVKPCFDLVTSSVKLN